MGAALAGAIIVAFALVSGLSADSSRSGGGSQQEAVAASSGPPESIAHAPAQYGSADLPSGQGEVSGEVDPPVIAGDELAPPFDPMWRDAAAHEGPGASASPPLPSPQDIARQSAIFFAPDAQRRVRTTVSDEDASARLNSRLTPPPSRFVLQAGHVIPGALITALNSDLPGRVVAQVTAPVFDSVTGDHLLIPQGSRLIGAYESAARHGDHRILLVWSRLVLPNGWSVNLQEMPATDGAGASGLSDRTDNHLDRLGVAIGLSAILSIIASESEEDEENDNSLAQSVGDAAAAQAASSGGRIVDRELTVRPTLRIRAGAPVRVLVTRDITLRPYAGPVQ
jgi:type IV secretory pathway VirB10-like protein